MPETTDPQHSEASPQHTPGPWRADGAEVYAEGFEWVAEALNDKLPDGGEANANLIAAAPDLLAACKDMREILLGITPMRVGAALATSVAAVAIAKAEGRQP